MALCKEKSHTVSCLQLLKGEMTPFDEFHHIWAPSALWTMPCTRLQQGCINESFRMAGSGELIPSSAGGESGPECYHKLLNQILERDQWEFIFVWPNITIQCRGNQPGVFAGISEKETGISCCIQMDTFIWISVWTSIKEKKKKNCYRQRLIDYKIYPHQSRTQEVKKSRKLWKESPLASEVLSQWWTEWEPPDCPHEVDTAQRGPEET